VSHIISGGLTINIYNILNQLINSCRHQYADLQITDLAIAACGSEFLICSGISRRFGPIAVRTPLTRWIVNANDQHIDARDLLLQEVALSNYLRTYGIPALEILHLQLDDPDRGKRQVDRVLQLICMLCE
jgi:hypothetical protein